MIRGKTGIIRIVKTFSRQVGIRSNVQKVEFPLGRRMSNFSVVIGMKASIERDLDKGRLVGLPVEG